MLTSLSLADYRGFSKLEMPDLARVNLIGGTNNSGKTAILEAIYLLLAWDDDVLKKLPGLFRTPAKIDDRRYFWRWIVNGNARENVALLTASLDGDGVIEMGLGDRLPGRSEYTWTRQLEGTRFGYRRDAGEDTRIPDARVFSPGPTPPVSDAQVYIKAVKASATGEERIEELLREVDPRLKRVRAFPDEKTNEPILHVGLNVGEALPASQLGQGFNRLLHIYSALLGAEAEVFLIDKVETGLHHSVLPTIWKGLAALARQQGVQIFATTHSREAILAAHRVFSEEPEYDFAYHRLERGAKGEVQAVTYGRERLEGADERNFELR